MKFKSIFASFELKTSEQREIYGGLLPDDGDGGCSTSAKCSDGTTVKCSSTTGTCAGQDDKPLGVGGGYVNCNSSITKCKKVYA